MPGQRQVVDLLLELSTHLVEPYLFTLLTGPVAAAPAPGPSAVIPVGQTNFGRADALYPGALVVLGWQSPAAEVVTVLQVFPTYFIANTTLAHATGEQVLSPHFPTQQPTDPIFTQSEIIDYIAQAQNELLTRVPLIFQLFPAQLIQIGQTYQTLPPTAIELERVAVQNTQSMTFSLVTIYRQFDLAWATTSIDVTQPPYSFAPGTQIQLTNVADPSFDSAPGQFFTLFSATSQLPGGQTFGGGGFGGGGFGGMSGAATIGWVQDGPNTLPITGPTAGIIAIPVYTRLYESSQETLSLNQPWWSAQGGQPPTQWFEDRAGIYGWGLAPPPQGNYYMELLCSVRASEDTLGLLSGFLVPDCAVPYVKYKVLEYVWSKNGVQRSPSMARYAKGRFDFGVMLFDRFLRNVTNKLGKFGG